VSSGLKVPKKTIEFVEQVGAMIALVRANRVPHADGIIEGPVKWTRRAALVPDLTMRRRYESAATDRRCSRRQRIECHREHS
jgi:hypothetical protein